MTLCERRQAEKYLDWHERQLVRHKQKPNGVDYKHHAMCIKRYERNLSKCVNEKELQLN